jgi:hypothetical protein
MLDQISVASMPNVANQPDAPDAGLGSSRLRRRSIARSSRPAASGLSRGNVMYLASVGVIAIAVAAVFFGAGYSLLAARAGGTITGYTAWQPDPQAIVAPAISLAVPPAAGSTLLPDQEVPLAASPAAEVLAQPVASPAVRTLPSPNPILSAAEISGLLEHGDALVQIGDIASARLFYERAATAGNGRAALRLGATFDPAFLERAGLHNLKGDAAAARSWYGRALDLGTAEAKQQLNSLENRQGR